eukprot:705111-Amphidinium_carterae.1
MNEWAADAPQALHAVRRNCDRDQCKVVFIKAFKCGSETVSSIIARFGSERNLAFALPYTDKIYLGWPFDLRPEFYRSSEKQSIDLLAHHSRYSRQTTQRLFPPSEYSYLTIVREPWSHVKSAFNYFDVDEVVALVKSLSIEDPFGDYLRHVEEYETIYMSQQ